MLQKITKAIFFKQASGKIACYPKFVDLVIWVLMDFWNDIFGSFYFTNESRCNIGNHTQMRSFDIHLHAFHMALDSCIITTTPLIPMSARRAMAEQVDCRALGRRSPSTQHSNLFILTHDYSKKFNEECCMAWDYS